MEMAPCIQYMWLAGVGRGMITTTIDLFSRPTPPQRKCKVSASRGLRQQATLCTGKFLEVGDACCSTSLKSSLPVCDPMKRYSNRGKSQNARPLVWVGEAGTKQLLRYRGRPLTRKEKYDLRLHFVFRSHSLSSVGLRIGFI